MSILRQELQKRPIIPIFLRNDKIITSAYALIDSGADYSIFHWEIADVLKLDLSKQEWASYGGIKKGAKEGSGKFGNIEISIDNKFFHKTAIMFSDDLSTSGYSILGQLGFFSLYKVGFDYKNDSIDIV